VTPGVPLLLRYAEGPDPVIWGRILELEGVLSGARSGSAGARIHRPDLAGWEHEVWVDCMHLDAPFLALLGQQTNDPARQALAVELLLSHARVLQDEASGLFSHGFDYAAGKPNRVHWGRGQGWALLGLVDTLHLLPPEQPGADEIRERLDTLVAGLARHEQEAGRWSTVVGRHDTYREASVSAFAALGIGRAIRWKLISAQYVDLVRRAFAATLEQLSADGSLVGVSNATPVGADAAHYDARPLGTHPWGQGPALLAAIEIPALFTR
ncbi:MAG TPA: glycoside hydrolase family 88 protein, partial [Thermomicrobiales bacterium]|nr:glycoside hydrolase family 88 protein [Thermomicrobiales bacterium]